MCPCAMRNAGLEPTDPWTPEKVAELQKALAGMFNWKTISSEKDD